MKRRGDSHRIAGLVLVALRARCRKRRRNALAELSRLERAGKLRSGNPKGGLVRFPTLADKMREADA